MMMWQVCDIFFGNHGSSFVLKFQYSDGIQPSKDTCQVAARKPANRPLSRVWIYTYFINCPFGDVVFWIFMIDPADFFRRPYFFLHIGLNLSSIDIWYVDFDYSFCIILLIIHVTRTIQFWHFETSTNGSFRWFQVWHLGSCCLRQISRDLSAQVP